MRDWYRAANDDLILRSALARVSKDGPRKERRQHFSFPRRMASEFCYPFRPRNIGGRREDRVTAAPMAPVREEKHGAGTTGTSRINRPSLRNGSTAYTCSPRWPGFVVTVISRSFCWFNASLGAPGPHDFAVRIMLLVRQYAASIASRCLRPWRSRYAPLVEAGRADGRSDLPDGARENAHDGQFSHGKHAFRRTLCRHCER